MKNRRPHAVPLNRQALVILEDLRTTSTNQTHVLPSVRRSVGAITVAGLEQALQAAAKAQAFGTLDAFTPHDLRRSLRTGLAQLGIDPITAERVLSHVVKISATSTVYDRHNYLPEMRRALEAWGDHVDELVRGEVAPSNVVPLRAG